MPLETIHAFVDHGDVARRLDRATHEAHETVRQIEAQGISMARVTSELLDEGVVAFARSFDELLETVEGQRKALATA
jgi:transaldolase